MTFATGRTSDVIGLMKRHRVHRLVIVDEANHPVGVVSASDLVRVTTDGAA